MKILIVASHNTGHFSPFVLEQAESLKNEGVTVVLFGIEGKGGWGYLKCRNRLLETIKKENPDIIHAHYGLSGLLANTQLRIKVITTYHGSDIHSGGLVLTLTKLCMRLSAYNIFVGESLFNIAKYKKENYIIQSCGLNLNVIHPIDRIEARVKMGLEKDKKYALFSGAFENKIKNFHLAKQSIDMVEDCELIELKGYSREEVNLLINAANLQLTTSINESGPLIVKEAMACNIPIVSTDVGDVRWVIGNTDGCFICLHSTTDCAEQIRKAINFSVTNKRTKGRERIIKLNLSQENVAKRILGIYHKIISGN